jgi:hypothetical protein
VSGVPYHLLRCPTCGGIMGHEVRWYEDNDESWMLVGALSREVITSHRFPYLTCCHGHRWTIKQITRSDNAPDEVLLGELIFD